MLPQSQQRKKRNSSKVNLMLSLGFHAIIVLALLYLAARTGVLGEKAKIAVEMVKEKKPEEVKKQEKKEPPKVDVPKIAVVTPKMTEAPKMTSQAPPPTGSAVAPPVAPPPSENASFVFDGGKLVETSSDPVQLYKGSVENTFRSRWDRPEDMDDHAFVAEVEISIDRSGRISDPVWKKNSGNKRWDDSVREAVARTTNVNLAPPTNFPPRVVVRFDVTESEPVLP